MNPIVLAAVIAAIPPTLVAIVGVVVTIRGQVKSQEKIQQVHIEINSRMTQLLDLTSKASHAEGVRDARDGR